MDTTVRPPTRPASPARKPNEPYCSNCDKDLTVVRATLYVEREGQKGILVGKGGSMIREIGSRARASCESRFGGKFFLDLRVDTHENWREDPSFLARIVNPEV